MAKCGKDAPAHRVPSLSLNMLYAEESPTRFLEMGEYLTGFEIRGARDFRHPESQLLGLQWSSDSKDG